MGKAYKKVLI
jgi:hypothetical protein